MSGRSDLKHCPDCPSYQVRYANVEVCRQCGLGRTLSTLSPGDQQDYVTVGGGALKLAQRRDYFQRLHRKYLAHLPRGRSLDVGCGRGQLVEVLLESGWDGFGLDAYQGSLQGERFMRGTLDDLRVDATFDLVTLVHTLEHMTDPVASLRRVANLLGRTGTLLIVVPNFAGQWSEDCGEQWPMLDVRNHAFHYTPAALRTLLEYGGFSIRAMDTYSGYAASAWQRKLGASGFYERGWGSRQPVRSLVFRFNTAARPLLNACLDAAGRGAEIIAVASRR